MLRITEGTSRKKSTILRLEGQLIGPWVNELSRVCETPITDGRKVTIDLAEVSFADRKGVSLLRELRLRGAVLANESVFLKEQLNGS